MSRPVEHLQRKIMKHGYSHTPTHNTWTKMKQRCYDIDDPAYPDYGGRGIKVCDRWLGPQGFLNFLADMGERPDGMSIDRTDPDGDYSPENCRWATKSEQSSNQRPRKSFKNKKAKNRYVNVYYHKGRYSVNMTIGGKMIYMGQFGDEDEAAYVRDQIILQTRDDQRSELNVLEYDHE